MDFVTRRDVVKGGSAVITLAASAAARARAAATEGKRAIAAGVVFEERSGGVERARGDPGIPGVLVSNGREVVRTDSDGSYSLPVDDGDVIFVIKPTGYAARLARGTMLPRFHYIYQPDGTPAHLGLRYRGITPSGPLPGAIDFALRKVDEPTEFDVLLFSDPHAGSQAEIDFIRDDFVSPLIGTKAAFGITTGDIMSDDLSHYARYNAMIGQLGLPWYNIIGNHDLNLDAPDGRYSRETFKQTFGPTYYAFEFGGVLFLMLDNVEYFGARPGRANDDCHYQGRFGAPQLAFVANVLKETPLERMVVACMHIPLATYLDPTDPASNTADRSAFLELLRDRPSISFAGHTHTTEHHYLRVEDGDAGTAGHHHHVLTAVSGSWWSGPYDRRGVAAADSQDGTPNGFHILSLDRDRAAATTRYRPAKEPNERQIRCVLEPPASDGGQRMGQLNGAPIAHDQVGLTDLVVNIFDGGPRTMVEYQIGARAPVPMNPQRRQDPFVKEVFARNAATKKPWVKAEDCAHMWVARLPGDLEAGTHCITVRVADEYGRAHQDHLVLEAVARQAASVTVPG